MITRPGSISMSKFSAISTASSLNFLSKTNKRFLTWRSFIRQTQSLLIQNNIASVNTHNLVPLYRSLAQVRSEPPTELWFTSSFPARTDIGSHYSSKDATTKSVTGTSSPGSGRDHKPPDERMVKLGSTLRTLSPLLPTIFTTPLPTDLLNPSITLHLFPSTHPHLPVVKSRVPCRAALWTAPVAWGSVPIVGNVRVEIMSEKIVRTGYISAPVIEENDAMLGEEKLVVRWKTEGKKNDDPNTTSVGGDSNTAAASAQSLSSSNNEINRGLSTLLGGSQPLFSTKGPSDPFTGLFIFSFDKDGKIASLTIEHADESRGFDKTSRVITLTDWLLGKARWGRVEGTLVPGLAYRDGGSDEMMCKEPVTNVIEGQNRKFTWSRRR